MTEHFDKTKQDDGGKRPRRPTSLDLGGSHLQGGHWHYIIDGMNTWCQG